MTIDNIVDKGNRFWVNTGGDINRVDSVLKELELSLFGFFFYQRKKGLSSEGGLVSGENSGPDYVKAFNSGNVKIKRVTNDLFSASGYEKNHEHNQYDIYSTLGGKDTYLGSIRIKFSGVNSRLSSSRADYAETRGRYSNINFNIFFNLPYKRKDEAEEFRDFVHDLYASFINNFKEDGSFDISKENISYLCNGTGPFAAPALENSPKSYDPKDTAKKSPKKKINKQFFLF